jgi:hypothetical protein
MQCTDTRYGYVKKKGIDNLDDIPNLNGNIIIQFVLTFLVALSELEFFNWKKQ